MGQASEARSEVYGAEFGPYKIVRRLGAGGMAETFEAIRQGPAGFTQRVCLKLVLPSLHEESAFQRLFEREANLAASLRHANIVGVLDYGEIDDQLYMALELVDGVDLLSLLVKRGQLDYEQVALLAIELTRALEHAHGIEVDATLEDTFTRLHGVIHRDVSPSNVLLSQQGEVMLADFGLAKVMSASLGNEALPTIALPGGRIKGKVPYMSPEQLRNEALDGRADIFSLGVLLYEALSSARPYTAGNDPATIMKILQGEHVPLRELARTAPEGFCAIVDRMISANRDERPTTATELLDELDPYAPSPQAQRGLGVIVAQAVEQMPIDRGLEALSGSGHTFVRKGKRIQSGIKVKDEAPKPSRWMVWVPLVVVAVAALAVGAYLLGGGAG